MWLPNVKMQQKPQWIKQVENECWSMWAHQFSADNLIDIVGKSEHNFTQKHIFECGQCATSLNTIVSFECFVKIGVSGFEVSFVGCMQNARLQVESTLHFWCTINSIGGRTGWSECGTSLITTEKNNNNGNMNKWHFAPNLKPYIFNRICFQTFFNILFSSE